MARIASAIGHNVNFPLEINMTASTFSMKPAVASDVKFWLDLDPGITPSELAAKMAMERCLVIREGDVPVGIFRYNLFWDTVPFLNLILLRERHRQKGYGTLAMKQWESDMRDRGYKVVLTSTQSDERAQFFYRGMGYSDCGCLILDKTPLRQPLEIFLIKVL